MLTPLYQCLVLGAAKLEATSRCGLTRAITMCCCSYSLGCSWPSLLPGQAAGSCAACCLPQHRVFSCCSPANSSPGCIIVRALLSSLWDSAFVPAELHKIPVGPFPQPLWVPLNGNSILKDISWSPQFSVFWEPDHSTLLPPPGH